MRCPDCNKFVSYEGDEEPEEQSCEVDDEGNINIQVTLEKRCGECSQGLKSAEFELEGQDDAVREHMEEHKDAPEGEHELSIEGEYESTEDSRGLKPTTPMRYRTTYYGVHASYTVTCTCGKTFEGELADEMSASGFEEMV
ncbi:MAG: hypothetical protein WC683_02680 [bacterium]